MEVDERGSFAVVLRVDDFEYLDPDKPEGGYDELERLLSGNPVTRDDDGMTTQISLAPRNTCTSFRLETTEGVLEAVGAIKYWIGNDEHGRYSIRVIPYQLRYEVTGKKDVMYWVVPLSNFVARFLQEPSPGVQENPLLDSMGGCSLIEFEFSGGEAFIERVPEYDSRVKELREGRSTNRVTSVMVGPVGDKAHDSFEELEEWVPFHLLGVLGLATGSEVGSPWVELRGKVYAVVEPDEGGEALKEKLTSSPALRDRLRLVELGGTKDISELHLSDPERFKERLRAACSRATLWSDLERAEADARTRGAWVACEDLARERRVLDRFAEELARSGVAGESRTAKLLYLALTSRFLQRPVSVAVKGPSSGGKTYLVERVLSFFPESAYYALTAMSERTLAYSEEPIRHRFLVIYEADGMASDFATYLMSSLLSEGRVRYETVESTPQGIRPRLIEREGPTGIITTTSVKLHPENETRLISLTVTDTRDQTRSVIRALAKRNKQEADLAPWLALQEWLSSPEAERRVEIPYAEDLAELVPPVAVRLRRDFGAVLNLIRAHAVLHQASREKDEEGSIVANLDDYEAIRELVADLVAEGVEATIPKTVRETVEAAKRLLEDSEGEFITTTAVAQELKLDKSAALRRVKSGIDRGHLKNLEDRKGRLARIVLGDPLAGEVEVLPTVERLAEQAKGCRVAGKSGGRDTPPPPALDPGESGGASLSRNGLEKGDSGGRRVQFTL